MRGYAGRRWWAAAVWAAVFRLSVAAIWHGAMDRAATQFSVLVPPPTSSRASICALLCQRDAGCGAFNMRADGQCQLLSFDDVCGAAVRLEPQHEAGSAFYQRRPCPQTCLQLKNEIPSAAGGVKHLPSLSVPVFCDMDHDGGGWTLVVASTTSTWTEPSVLRRNELAPTLTDDYSILELAGPILTHGTSGTFQYRLEAGAETGRRQWGGVWTAARSAASLVRRAPGAATNLTTRFSTWTTNYRTVEDHLPWISAAVSTKYLLTTSASDAQLFGTLCTSEADGGRYSPSPWIYPTHEHSGNALYWIKEQ